MQVGRIAILACIATVSLSAQDAGVPTRAGSAGTSHPRLLNEVVPAYPRIALSARISGDVIIGVVINEAGRIADTKIERSVPLLDAAALDAVRQWQFEPPIVIGRPGRLATTITVRFVIYDAEAPPPAGRTASPSGMPADFAVVYEYGCKPGFATGHVFTLDRASEAIFTVASHNLESVYRQLSESGLLSRTAGLRVWQEPDAARATVGADGVTLTVSATMGFLCSDQAGSPLYAVSVRSDGTWRRLWPPQSAELIPPEHVQQVSATRALIQQLLESK